MLFVYYNNIIIYNTVKYNMSVHKILYVHTVDVSKVW